MKKIFPILITLCLLIFSLPINALSYDGSWIDDLFFEDFSSEIILKEGSLSLYWSTNTYVPFGYQGRKLATTGSKVTVNAHLEIVSGNPANLKYSWFLDNVFQQSKSGYGRDSFQLWVGRPDNTSHTVLLKVFNEDRSFTVEKSITIPVTKPELVIYNKTNGQIKLPYTASTNNFSITTNEENSFAALPYFFSIKSLKDLEFSWSFADKTYEESSLTANVFGLKIINKEMRGLLEQTLKVIAVNRRQPEQKVQETIKVNIY